MNCPYCNAILKDGDTVCSVCQMPVNTGFNPGQQNQNAYQNMQQVPPQSPYQAPTQSPYQAPTQSPYQAQSQDTYPTYVYQSSQQGTPSASDNEDASDKEGKFDVNEILNKAKGLASNATDFVKKDSKRALIYIGGAIAALVLIVVVLSAVFGGSANYNYVVYEEDNTLYFRKVNSKESIEIYEADDYIGSTQVSKDGKYIAFIADSELYYSKITSKPKPKKIDSKVYDFYMNENGKELIYISDGDLFRSNTKKSKELESDVDDFLCDQSCNRILYFKNEKVYMLNGKKSTKICRSEDFSDATLDLKYIAFIDDGELSIVKSNGKAKKVADDVDSSYNICLYDDGTMHYISDDALFYYNGSKSKEVMDAESILTSALDAPKCIACNEDGDMFLVNKTKHKELSASYEDVGYSVEISYDGSIFYFVEDDELKVFKSSKPTKAYFTANDVDDWMMSYDSNDIYYTEDDTLMKVTGKKSVEITDDVTDLYHITPDGMAVFECDDDDIFVCTGKKAKKIESDIGVHRFTYYYD